MKNKAKQTNLVLLVMIVFLISIVLFVACSNSGPFNNRGEIKDVHEHDFGEWFVLEEPTCLDKGVRMHICSTCGAIVGEETEALGHLIVVDQAVAPTCTETGLTEGAHCSRCGEVLIAQEVIQALGHQVVIDEMVQPTETTNGLTEGSHCSRCGEVFVPQYEIPMQLSKYSYRLGLDSIPTSWNAHTYQSDDAELILNYSTDGLYAFDYKDNNYDSFAIVPSMAADYPYDITSIVAADPNKAALWNLCTGEYEVEAAAEGAYVVRADYLENDAGSVPEDDIISYQDQYAEYVANGVYVRVNVGDAVLASEHRVYSISLKHNLKFDNGDPITASTFVESMKLLLQPDANNFRADNVYKTGNLKIANAEEYFKAGKQTYEDLTTNGSGVGQGAYTGWNNSAANYGLSNEMLANLYFVTSTNSYVGAWAADWVGRDVDWTYGYCAKYYGGASESRTVLEACYNEMNEKSLAELLADGAGFEYTYEDADGNEQEAKLLYKTAIDYLIKFWCVDPNEEFGFFCAPYTWPELPFEDVGFYADPTDDYALIIVLKNAMEPNFYLKYELCTSFFLVHPAKYQECISYDTGVYTNSYGTSVDKYIGYGPYKLTQYVADSTIILEKNPLWHGFDPEDASYLEGAYQTDRVVFTKVTNKSAELEMFLNGELDNYDLQSSDMNNYRSSDYIAYKEDANTWYLAMNPQEANLQTVQAGAAPLTKGNAVVKTVLCINDFRKALSYSIDREQFNIVLSPTSTIATSLLTFAIIADPNDGHSYRSLDIAKDVLLNYWGLADQWGEGKKYATRDDAIASITGYDPEGAKALFYSAYNQAVARGYITSEQIASGKWEVQIVIGRPSAENYYNDGYDFLKANWTKAVEGTPFEGHLSFIQSQILGSTSFGSYLRNGSVDILFHIGYGESMFDPYSTMDCYTGSLQYDPFTDKNSISLDVTYDFGEGVHTYRASLYNWVSVALQGDKITITELYANGEATDHTLSISAGASDPAGRRIAILAAAEEKILNLSNIFPLQTDASASLRCMRINYKTDDYVYGIGFGGVKYMTYTMNDLEFAVYVATQGGTLQY